MGQTWIMGNNLEDPPVWENPLMGEIMGLSGWLGMHDFVSGATKWWQLSNGNTCKTRGFGSIPHSCTNLSNLKTQYLTPLWMTFSRLQCKRLPMHLTVNTHEGERKQSHIAKEQVSLAIIIMFNISPLSDCFSWSHLCVPCSGVRCPSFHAPPTHWLKSINFNTKLIQESTTCNAVLSAKEKQGVHNLCFLKQRNRQRERESAPWSVVRWPSLAACPERRQTLVIAVSAGIQQKCIKDIKVLSSQSPVWSCLVLLNRPHCLFTQKWLIRHNPTNFLRQQWTIVNQRLFKPVFMFGWLFKMCKLLRTVPELQEASTTLTAMLSGTSCKPQQRSIISVKIGKTIKP